MRTRLFRVGLLAVISAVLLAVAGPAGAAPVTFTPATGSPFPTGGSSPYFVTSADFDGVNGPDLATANTNSNSVSVLLNDGSGGFGSPTPFPWEMAP